MPSGSPRILAASGTFSGGEATCAEAALATAATLYAAPAQTPQAEQPQPRFLPATRGTDPVGVI